jgi:adenosylcobinamide kinase/adenosylcobinamide-phosphate guanylyltransferase
MGELTFILGAARSGKSTFAVELAQRHAGTVLYVATLQPMDDEMRERVVLHRQERPAEWATLEEPVDVTGALGRAPHHDVYLLDCATLWVSNLLLREHGYADYVPASAAEGPLNHVRELIEWQRASGANLIVVSNEVGAGIVPEYALARAYRDTLGRANRMLADAADKFYYVVAGFYLDIKASGWKPILPDSD